MQRSKVYIYGRDAVAFIGDSSLVVEG